MNNLIIVLLIFIQIILPRTKPVLQPSQAAIEETSTLSIAFDTFESTLNLQPSHLASIVVSPSLAEAHSAISEPESVKQIAQRLVSQAFGAYQFTAFDKVITHESNWNTGALNQSSGACGLAQALPCKNLIRQSPEDQVKWAITYITQRYGTPEKAWNHELAYNWY